MCFVESSAMKRAIFTVSFMLYAAFIDGIKLPKFTLPKQVIGNITGIVLNNLPGNDDQNITDNVQFFLYTRKNRDEGQQIWIDNDDGLSQSNFDPALMTKIVIHGWRNNHTSPISTLVKDAFLEQDSYNIILVDWGNIAKLIYPLAVAQLDSVAEYVGKLIVYLENGMIDIKKLTMVGHSLGAHVVGLSARFVNETIAKSVLHIVGLDPANPGFEILARNLRLRSKDADEVEIVHSNTGLNGLFEPIGDIDFYPNGYNSKQPGCGVDLIGSCAHSRSYKYYAEALTRPTEWVGLKCGSFVQFLTNLCKGNEVASFPLWTANFTKPRGTYVLVTDDHEPFGLGLKGIDPRSYFEVLVS